uniref:YBR2038-ORF n=1 Tax=Saccharomyces cerevisiae TaxID=4932 RepID=E9PA39_YEASX|nr:unnamed protein product [Saccharomyces cerevisiae]prf//2206494T ORF YBR2038 [Saccharomyces cerevisiae]
MSCSLLPSVSVVSGFALKLLKTPSNMAPCCISEDCCVRFLKSLSRILKCLPIFPICLAACSLSWCGTSLSVVLFPPLLLPSSSMLSSSSDPISVSPSTPVCVSLVRPAFPTFMPSVDEPA